MHIDIHLRRSRVLLVVGGMVLLAVAGAAYATIPDGNGVYTACRLNALGTIRLIDPSAPSTSLLGHCTSFETQITWNQKGQKGDKGAPGLPGANGAPGADGVSPTVTQLSPGDSHCPAGGAAIADASGVPAYVCSGQPFSGTFTSPNEQYSLSVTDGGVEIVGPDSTINVSSTSGVTIASNSTVTVKGNHGVTVQSGDTLTVKGDRNVNVQGGDTVTVKGDNNVKVQGNDTVTVQGSGGVTVDGASVGINGGTACRPVARLGDLIEGTGGGDASVTGDIVTGSPTVCVG